MGSGNYASPAGWNNTGKPTTVAECDHAAEPRGAGVFYAGLCVDCGRATIHRGADGEPRHRRRYPVNQGTCADCHQPMTIYQRHQTTHPSCGAQMQHGYDPGVTAERDCEIDTATGTELEAEAG